MQIRSKLTIQFFLITAALLLSALLAIYFFTAKIQQEQFFETLEARANTTADLLIRVEQVDSSMLKLIDQNKKDILNHENISVYDVNYKEIYTNNDTLHFSKILPDFPAFLSDIALYGKKEIQLDNLSIIGVKYFNKNQTFVVVASAVDTDGIRNLQNLRRILVLVFIFILVIISITGWLFAGKALNPISNVINQVDTITANNLNLRIDEGNKRDEIARLTITFNKLLDRIEHAFKTQKSFVSNASHELRNPLTTITSQIEVSLLKVRTTTEYENILASVLEDIKRLNEMSHRLLTLTKMDQEIAGFQLQVVRFDDLVWEAKREFLNQYPDYKAILTLSKLPENENELNVKGNVQFLKICFFNLMENACKFSPDKKVDIDLVCDKKTISVTFFNKGVAIDAEDVHHIFEPFYRGKNSGIVKGYGVGLSIVERIVQVHKGTIRVVSEATNGTAIMLTFPHL